MSGTGPVAAVDGQHPKNGLRALHVQVPAGGPARATLNQRADAGITPSNNVFGRAEIFYVGNADAGLPVGVHSTFFAAVGQAADGGNASINMGGGGAMAQFNYHWPAGTEQSQKGGTITTNTWHCIQWQIDGSGNPPKDTAKLWIDGTLAVNVTAATGWDFTRWTSFDFGFNHFQTLGNAVDFYLDDVALDDTMIPCR